MPKNLTPEQQAEWKKKKLAYVQEWVANNPEKARKNKQKHYGNNKEKVKSAAKNWRSNNPEKVKLTVAKYQANNKEKLLAISRKRYSDNRDTLLEYHKQYREKNRELVAERVRTSQRKNPLRLRIAKYTRRVREKGGSITTGCIEQLLSKQKNQCVYCKTALSDYHVDHIMPLALGGANDDSNIQILCPTCNRKKGAKHPDDFEREYGYCC